MRIRTIKPEFFIHEGLFEAEKESKLPLRLAFIGLWCAADREGRFKWEPRRLGVQIMPYDHIDFSRVLDALTTRGFIQRYASESRDFGCIPSFARHQVINNRERESELPEPPPLKDSDACPTREPRVDHAGKAEGKGREQGKEGEGADSADAESVIGPNAKPKAKRELKAQPIDDEYLAKLQSEYPHAKVSEQFANCTKWWLEKKKVHPSRRALVNWLDKVQPPPVASASIINSGLGDRCSVL
jgi:hypothetical protein